MPTPTRLVYALLAGLPLLSRAAENKDSCDSCSVARYQNTGFGTLPCAADAFGCYPGENQMWIRPPCGGFFRCSAEQSAVRCGSRYFKPAPGQVRLNCTCGEPSKPRRKLQASRALRSGDGARSRSRVCGEHTSMDNMGGVSAAFKRLPMPAGANPSLKCCRNKPNAAGSIDWNVTLKFTNAGVAPWPSVCEDMCERHPSGRCRFFSHSVKWKNCLICAACVPEVMLGDDTFASFARASEDPATLYTGRLV